MTTFLPSNVLAFSFLSAFVVFPERPVAASQQPDGGLPVSVERIRKEVEKPPARRLKVDVRTQLPVATFKTSVDERVYMLPFLEHFRKQFELTPLQRQSQEWTSKYYSSIFTPKGVNLLRLKKSVDRALQRRDERKARQQVTRELAEVEAARKK